MAYLQTAAALTQNVGLRINTKGPITEQEAGADDSYWTKPPSITFDELSEAAVSTGWLQHRDVKKYLPCH